MKGIYNNTSHAFMAWFTPVLLFRLLLMITLASFSCFAKIDLVKVIKSEQSMVLYEQDSQGKKKKVKQYHVVFGGSPQGHKQQEGDQKTPEGIYTLDYKKEDSSYYRAMHISYPNQQDLAKAKTLGVSAGGFIMVHGQRNGFSWAAPVMQNFNWTNGCIALTNDEMDEFMDLVDVGTQIHIVW